MYGPFFNDLAEPHIDADVAAVTLAATNKALIPVSNIPLLGAHFFGRRGRKVRIRLFGRITTAVTPGNLTLGLYWGTGADANGVLLASSAAIALIASQTNLSWWIEWTVHCRSPGSAGTLFAVGRSSFNPAVIASTAQPILMPASAPAVSAACDLTSQTLVLSPQALRSGSTAETMQVHDVEYLPLN